MTAIQRLFKLYKLTFNSHIGGIDGDTYFAVGILPNGLKMNGREVITQHRSIEARLYGFGSVKDYLDDIHSKFFYEGAKKKEAQEFLKTLRKCDAKLLRKHLR